MMRMLAVLAVTAGLTVLPARAAGRLAVVELASPPSMVGLAAQVQQAVQKEARSQGSQVLSPEEVRRALGEGAVAGLQGCRASAPCLAARLQPLGVARAVVGELDRTEEHYRVRLVLVDVAAARELARVDRSIRIASRRLVRDVQEALPALLLGRGEARGTLRVEAPVPNVPVQVEGVAVGRTPLTLKLPPGSHRVRLDKHAYFPVERLVTVEAGRTTTERVPLVRRPGMKDPDVDPAPTDTQDPPHTRARP